MSIEMSPDTDSSDDIGKAIRRLRRHAFAGGVNALEEFYLRDEAYRNMETRYRHLIPEHIRQASPSFGILGVTVANQEGIDIRVIDVLAIHRDPGFRESIDGGNADEKNTLSTYDDAVAERLGITTDAVMACRAYAARHKDEFEAYFTLSESIQQRDPLVPPHQQQPLPQLP